MPLRPSTLLPCIILSLALGGCFAAGPGAESAPELNAQASAAPPAGRGTTAPKPPSGPARTASAGNKDDWTEGGVTREKINGMCWMKAEGQRGLSVDKRADFVDRCVAETLKEYPIN